MYLTEILLNAAFCFKNRITDDYSLHRVVYSMFPLEKQAGRFLYADKGARNGLRRVLVLSAVLPEIPADVMGTTREISDRFFSAPAYRFEILLNPVKCSAQTGKREPVLGQLPLLNYFTEKMTSWGFEAMPEKLEVRTLPSACFRRDGQECRFHRVKYSGILKITDPEKFRACFNAGIGHGKAFGFGLLQLVPIQ